MITTNLKSDINKISTSPLAMFTSLEDTQTYIKGCKQKQLDLEYGSAKWV